MFIDVANSGDRNVIKREAEKILKYKDITIEIQRMWNVKTEVIPVIIGATGTISKSLRKYLSNVPGKHEIKESANVKYKTFNMGNKVTCIINCNHRIAATLCTLETWFVSGM
jgi:hypothetical protein